MLEHIVSPMCVQIIDALAKICFNQKGNEAAEITILSNQIFPLKPNAIIFFETSGQTHRKSKVQ
jgi:hypothetical protein